MNRTDLKKLPRHLAVIMDGNGRWAQARGMTRLEGHRAGAESVRVITRTCREIGLQYLTLYAFSEENWQRPKPEVEGLMTLLNRYLKNELREMLENGIRFNVLGDVQRLPKVTQKLIADVKAETAHHRDMVLSLALSYGGRQEIIKACRDAARDCLAGRRRPEDLTEDVFAGYLFSSDLPDPDFLIRTSGEFRISNFLLWQIAYTELYITETAWPDFREEQLLSALFDYQGRERRFGKTGDQVGSDNREKG